MIRQYSLIPNGTGKPADKNAGLIPLTRGSLKSSATGLKEILSRDSFCAQSKIPAGVKLQVPTQSKSSVQPRYTNYSLS